MGRELVPAANDYLEFYFIEDYFPSYLLREEGGSLPVGRGSPFLLGDGFEVSVKKVSEPDPFSFLQAFSGCRDSG
jgi:hypothetical protein